MIDKGAGRGHPAWTRGIWHIVDACVFLLPLSRSNLELLEDAAAKLAERRWRISGFWTRFRDTLLAMR